ncbi:DHDDS [Bugula neritina]|uniref:Alkyl transferase n=1 Tax=Bugula neritina TaxID=10212 RepID=A0A7J7KEA3_BUGNE|nr:DHDDS [Bugula neritina]
MIPKHIAIIMDGNRRFAKQKYIARQQGHMKGFDKLTETLEWCLDIGINEVTVYAFSIENFKRSKEEVDGLMQLLKVKLEDLIADRKKIEENGVCVRALGNISLLPPHIQKLVAEVENLTSGFNRSFLNICLAYTSREEMTSSIKLIAEGLAEGKLEDSDVDSKLIESCLYSNSCQPLDLLLRTSGEVRLSDFLLWQSSYTLLSFVNVLWPEFSRWDLYAAVLFYQRHQGQLEDIKRAHDSKDTSVENELTDDTALRKEIFLEDVNNKKRQQIENLISIK